MIRGDALISPLMVDWACKKSPSNPLQSFHHDQTIDNIWQLNKINIRLCRWPLQLYLSLPKDSHHGYRKASVHSLPGCLKCRQEHNYYAAPIKQSHRLT